MCGADPPTSDLGSDLGFDLGQAFEKDGQTLPKDFIVNKG